jgi:penicillin amidase
MRKPIAFCLVLLLNVLTFLLPAQGLPAQSIAAGAQVNGSTIQLTGLRRNVTVQRDERGIPYIEAANEEDLYFAQGFVVAGDRLWQMDLLRRTARGELSEIFGRATLEDDKRHRAFGFAALAEQMVSRLSQPARAAIEAYAHGVNAFIESLDEKSLPPEFRVLQYKPRSWRPADSLLIGKVFAESLNTTWQRDLMRAAFSALPQERRDALLPVTSPLDVIIVGSDTLKKKPEAINRTSNSMNQLTRYKLLDDLADATDSARRSLERVGLYAEDLAASNNWVVSGKHSVTSKPLLANDPHLQASAPSIWHMVHLSAPGFRGAGVTVAGMPGILIGHNDRIAWGITNVEADVQDLYLEKFEKENPLRYMTPTGWREAETRREEIKVRKSPASPETETIEHNVTVTRHGPIVFEQDAARYALAWPALDPTSIEIEVYYWIAHGRNWQDFRAALSRYNGFPLNYVYADVDGHIGYWAAGRYPLRKVGRGEVPGDGATDARDWTGYIPFEATPHVYDPPSGIIATANNRIVGLDYLYYITDDWAAPYRARRIHDLLTAKAKLSVDDFRAIQADTYSFPDAIFAAEIVKIGRPLAASSPEWRELIAAFDGWDGMMKAESRVTPISFMMRDAFQRNILAGALGPELARRYGWSNSGTFFDRIITTRPPEWLPKGFDSYQALLLACYKEARETLTKRLGAENSQWTWGRLMQLRFPHPLAGAPGVGAQFAVAAIPQNGGGSTVNRAGAVSMRFIADTGNWDNTRMGIPLGESGNPASPHWKDQLADWQTANTRPFAFSKSAVAVGTKEMVTLVPHPMK